MVKILLDGVVVDRDLPEQSPPTSDEVRSIRNNKLRSEVDVIASNALHQKLLALVQQQHKKPLRLLRRLKVHLRLLLCSQLVMVVVLLVFPVA